MLYISSYSFKCKIEIKTRFSCCLYELKHLKKLIKMQERFEIYIAQSSIQNLENRYGMSINKQNSSFYFGKNNFACYLIEAK